MWGEGFEQTHHRGHRVSKHRFALWGRREAEGTSNRLRSISRCGTFDAFTRPRGPVAARPVARAAPISLESSMMAASAVLKRKRSPTS